MTTTPSFIEAGQAQLAIMARALERAETKGYFLLIHGENKDARSDTHLYGYFAGAFPHWIADWGAARGRRCLVIDVWLKDVPKPTIICKMRVPRRVGFKPINIALGMMSKAVSTRNALRNDAELAHHVAADWIEYRGTTRAALDLVVSVLEMPHHAEILTGKFRAIEKE